MEFNMFKFLMALYLRIRQIPRPDAPLDGGIVTDTNTSLIIW